MSLLSVEGSHKSFDGVAWRNARRLSWRAGCRRHGPSGAGEIDDLQHGGWPAGAGPRCIVLAGTDITGLPPRRIWRLGVGRTFQIAQTFLSMSVTENVQMALISLARPHTRVVA